MVTCQLSFLLSGPHPAIQRAKLRDERGNFGEGCDVSCITTSLVFCTATEVLAMRSHHYRNARLGWLIVALCGLVAACGVRPSSGGAGSAGGTEPSFEATVEVSGTAMTAHPLSTPSSTVFPGTPGTTATATPGKVSVVLGATSPAPGDIITVTIGNGLSAGIAVTDHHTNCTYVQLQKEVSGTWQPIGVCKLMTPTRLVMLPAGSVTPQKIGIPNGPGAAGTYRVMLMYGAASSSGQGNVAYSSSFTVS